MLSIWHSNPLPFLYCDNTCVACSNVDAQHWQRHMHTAEFILIISNHWQCVALFPSLAQFFANWSTYCQRLGSAVKTSHAVCTQRGCQMIQNPAAPDPLYKFYTCNNNRPWSQHLCQWKLLSYCWSENTFFSVSEICLFIFTLFIFCFVLFCHGPSS